MTMTGSASGGVSFTDSTFSDTEFSTVTIGQTQAQSFADGVGAGQCNAFWQDTRTLLTSANEGTGLDFAPTSSSGKTGVVTFARIKVLYVRADPTNTTTITVSKPTNGLNIFTGTTPALAALTPGGVFLFVDPSATGIPVAAGTSDLLQIANSAGASANYTIIVAGGLT
jgi:hypothetical protein